MSQFDFSAYLSHFIKLTGTIRSMEGSQGTTEVSYVFYALCFELLSHASSLQIWNAFCTSTSIYVQIILPSNSAKNG